MFAIGQWQFDQTLYHSAMHPLLAFFFNCYNWTSFRRPRSRSNQAAKQINEVIQHTPPNHSRPREVWKSLGCQAVMFSLDPHATGAFTERAPSRQQASKLSRDFGYGLPIFSLVSSLWFSPYFSSLFLPPYVPPYFNWNTRSRLYISLTKRTRPRCSFSVQRNQNNNMSCVIWR